MNNQETCEPRSTPTTQVRSHRVLVEEMNGKIYFARVPGFIKIGWAADVPARLAKMQTGSPHVIELLATLAGTMMDERQMHDRFAHIHVRGEWFQEHPLLLTYIEKKVKRAKAPRRRRLIRPGDAS